MDCPLLPPEGKHVATTTVLVTGCCGGRLWSITSVINPVFRSPSHNAHLELELEYAVPIYICK